MSEVDGLLSNNPKINVINGRNSRASGRGSCYIIREVYENGSAVEYFESQLDFAIDSGIRTIIIEPTQLGKETVSWISLGRWIRHSASLVGISCLLVGLAIPDHPIFHAPLGVASFIMGAVHFVSWQTDSCSKYKQEKDQASIQCLPVSHFSSSAPVVLVLHNDIPNIFYPLISIAALSFSIWSLFKDNH